MQITPEMLRHYAETTVEKRTRDSYTILAVYLTGSLLTEKSPFFGGTTDVDLVFIHIGNPEIEREIVRLNDDVHLDIAHHPQRAYMDRISLRTHPWMGPILAEAVVLHDPQHFMGLTQASVRGLFHDPSNIAKRAETQIRSARDGWRSFQPPPEEPGVQEFNLYLDILDSATNAVALLVGEPLTERRFLVNFQERAERIKRPGLYPGLLGMLGAPKVDKEILTSWVSEWVKTVRALPEDGRPTGLHPDRRNYYLKAFEVLLESEQPEKALWPLLRTWTLAASAFPENDLGFQNWKDALHQIGLLGPGFAERILALDAFLEQVEDTISAWGLEEGA
jgi:hypothetical protein